MLAIIFITLTTVLIESIKANSQCKTCNCETVEWTIKKMEGEVNYNWNNADDNCQKLNANASFANLCSDDYLSGFLNATEFTGESWVNLKWKGNGWFWGNGFEQKDLGQYMDANPDEYMIKHPHCVYLKRNDNVGTSRFAHISHECEDDLQASCGMCI